MTSRALNGNKIEARLGPSAEVTGTVTVSKTGPSETLHFDGEAIALVAKNFRDLNPDLIPKRDITVSTLFSIEKEKQWGGIFSLIRDNGGAEKGLVVGYNEKRFYFGLATTGADDGDGSMTYLESDVRYEPGKLFHVVATYDGQTMQLFVNGQLAGQSKQQSGDILYPAKTPMVIGGYKDSNEEHRHVGQIGDVAIYAMAAKPTWVAKEFKHFAEMTKVPGLGVEPTELEIKVAPYLQNVTQNSIVVMWETNNASNSVVRHGESANTDKTIESEKQSFIHEVKIEGLKPETQYFYKVASSENDQLVESEVFTFQTASRDESPFAFAIISDTQGNPEVSGKLAKHAWAQRPNFMLHPGDLVDTGTNDRQWVEQYFKSMHPLISRVPFFPVLGNHEQNARNYYDYMSLPDPEYYYQFTYGNTEFFMIDTNKNVGRDSQQYAWLDKALTKSKATWKIVCHHHPAYSSDENDYGDLWKTNQSTRGDVRVRELTTLYDKHNVDIVWSGHIHSYERTWCVRNDKVVAEGQGPFYMITGGGGGHLETAAPMKPNFQNNVRHGHHYCMVCINGTTLEFKAFDLENRLFDYLKLAK